MKIKRIISIFMLLVISLTFISCNQNDINNGTGEKVNINTITYSDGLHESNISYSENEFIKDGKTDYKVVIPNNASDKELFAGQEFNAIFKMSTGSEIEIITDKNISFSDDSKYIFIGNTKFTNDNVDLSFNELLSEGYKILTVGKSIFICGAKDSGTINGVYGFMQNIFGYRFYAVDEYKVDTILNLRLPIISIADKPDFDYREDNYGEIIRDETLRLRMQMTKTETLYLFGRNCHNCFEVIPRYNGDSQFISGGYEVSHSDWFNSSKNQLCYSNEGMIEEYIKNLKTIISKVGTDRVVLMGQADNTSWCDCEACSSSKEKYGTDSAVMVKFANRVSSEINQWIKDEYPDSEPMRFLVFAYYATNDAPAVYNPQSNQYEPIYPEMKFNDNVGVMYAAPMDYMLNFQDEKNEKYYTALKGWSALTNTIHYWAYSLYSWELFVPFVPYATMQNNYKTLLNYGVCSLFDQTKHMQGVSTGFSRLHAFVDTNLSWNVNVNVQDLIDEFFPEYFKDASPFMRAFFDELLLWYNHLYADTDFSNKYGSWGSRFLEKEYWNKSMLERWLSYTKQAKDSIEYLSITDIALYNKLYNRILLEEMSIRYILIDVYADTYSQEIQKQLKFDFYNDYYKFPLDTHEELNNISALWYRWDMEI